MADIVPSNFLRFQAIPSMWEDINDLDTWFSTSNGALSGLSISEDDKNIYIETSVPGVDPQDIDVTFHKGILWIKGQAKEEEKEKKYYRKATSSFSYRVAIPEGIDPNIEPQAECQNGVMKVTFAKSPKSQPRKITVKAVGDGKKAEVTK